MNDQAYIKSNQQRHTTPWAWILTLIFVVLKLTGNVAWAWVWVLSPLWIGYALVGVGFGLAYLLTSSDEKKAAENARANMVRGSQR